MKHTNLIDVSREFVVRKHMNGIKLVKPDYNAATQQTVNDILKLPLSIIFLNRHSAIQSINATNANALGFDSVNRLTGRTIRSAYKQKSADFSINHDTDVIARGEMLIKEEYCERIDEASFYAITAKLPWYDSNDSIIGLMGCSIAVGLRATQDLQNTWLSFLQLNFLKPSKNLAALPFYNSFLSKREIEVLHYIIRGHTSKKIAQAMNLSPRTVEQYLENIKFKYGASTKSELIERVIDNFI